MASADSSEHAASAEHRVLGAKVDELNTLAWELRYTDHQRGLLLSEEAYHLALSLDDRRRLAYSLRARSFCLYRLSHYAEALTSAQEALELFTVSDDKRGLEGTHNTLGVTYVMLGDLISGLQHFHVMQGLCQELGDQERQVGALNNIGAVYFYLSDYPNALSCHLRAAELLETLPDELGRARSLNNIGLTLYKLGDFEAALGYLQGSLELLESLQDRHAYALTLDNLGLVHAALGDFEQALGYHQGSLSLRQEIDDQQGISEALGNLGTVYAELNDFGGAERAFRESAALKQKLGDKRGVAAVSLKLGQLLTEQRKFTEALAVLTAALASAEAVNVKESVYQAHFALSKLYKQKKQLGEALTHHERYAQVKEEVFNEASSQKLQSLRVSFETERREREKELYRLKNAELTRANAELESLTESLRRADRERLLLLAQRERQANEDPLTGLYNRRYFDVQLSREFARARRFRQPLSVALCDLDHFKRINDTFSHALGDAVLKVTAQLFKVHFREVDTVARYGGEEFVVLLPQTSAQAANLACEGFRRALEAYPWRELRPGLQVTLSIGVADNLVADDLTSDNFSDKFGIDSDKALLSLADKNLYRAKRSGRNQTKY